MKSSLWLYAAAGYNVALAIFHLTFWRIFQWRTELPKLHPVNQGVVPVLNVMLVLVFLFVAAIQVLLRDEVLGSALGRVLLGGVMLFWIVRAILQPVFWRGVPRTTNIAFVMLFLAGAGLHALAFPLA